jgi:cytochrome c553
MGTKQMHEWKTMKKFLTGIVYSLVLAACGGESEPLATAIDIEAGRVFAEAHCTGCHTLEGQGRTAEIPNLAAQPAEYLVEAMHAYREGGRHHAALQDMITGINEPEIRNIAAYFASLPPVEPTPLSVADDSSYHRGAELAAVCTECHGERGVSTTPGIPSLAGQHPAYLIVSTQEYANGSRGHVEKEKMLSGLNDVDIEKMAMYFASQAPEMRQPPPFGDPDAGEPLTAVCGGCHGARGIGQDPLVPNLAGQEPVYLVNAIKAYRGMERSHEGMITDQSDEEIENIASFYSVQAAGSVSEAGAQTTDVIAKCERCHGQAAGQSTMVVPVLKGQQQEYLLRVMKQYRDGERGSSMMHKMSSGYSDELLEEIAAWYASHPKQ